MKKRKIIASIAAIGMIASLVISSKEKEKENKKENKNNTTEEVY
ncbi:hypothetical protein [Clostridium botulinum]|nr:hypothetical protein [Clostridium botulinum]AEB75247.1 hypothetical protein CbC4_0567 [Clostridium botulinum BKT015925]